MIKDDKTATACSITVQEDCVVGIDSSTSSTKLCVVGSVTGKIYYSDFIAHEILSPKPAWSENDPAVLVQNLFVLFDNLSNQVTFAGQGKISGIGITNQRETVVAWRKSDGQILNNAICWCDARTADICDKMISFYQNDQNHFKQITGLPISTYFSAFKIKWLLENNESVRKAHSEGDLLIGNINTFLIYNMTEG